MTANNKAEKKVQIAIDKMIELRENFILTDSLYSEIQRILDALNLLENNVSNSNIKQNP